MPQRALLLLFAVCACGFLAVGAYGARLEAQGMGDPASASPDEAERALDRLERAGGLTPDTRPEQSRAVLLLFARRHEEAARLAAGVVRREPDNVNGWTTLATALNASDPERAEDARRSARRLNPLARR